MKSTFDVAEFVRVVGQDLVRAFENARGATTPELVGDAMEQPVRDRLEQILPGGIGVGSGCVIDTKGGTSRQLDVVLFEKDLCPVFCVNNSPETTYYPCEAVVAVGEVKSTIGKRELADAFQKIKSVKSLHREFEEIEGGIHVGRRYGDQGSASSHGFHLDRTNKGDILGFVLAERPRISVTLPDPSRTHKSAPRATLLGHYADNLRELGNDVLAPDLVVFLDGTLLIPQTIEPIKPYMPSRYKSVLPHLVHPARAESPFGELLKEVWRKYRNGITAHIPLEKYLHYESKVEPNLTWAVIANVDPDSARLSSATGSNMTFKTPTDHLTDDLVPLGRARA